MVAPARGEIWWVDPDPTIGREQAGRRPALVISTDTFNRSPRGLVMVLLISSVQRKYPIHVRLDPAHSGLRAVSYVMCEQLRSISPRQLAGNAPIGQAPTAVLEEVEDILRTLLEL